MPAIADDQDAGLSVPRRVEIAHGAASRVACRCQRVHGARLEIDDADLVVLGVGDVQQSSPVKGETLRPIEARLREDAVAVALQAGTDRLDQLAVERRDDDAVVIGVGDEEAIRSSRRRASLPGYSSGRSAWRVAFEIERQRRAVDLAAARRTRGPPCGSR